MENNLKMQPVNASELVIIEGGVAPLVAWGAALLAGKVIAAAGVGAAVAGAKVGEKVFGWLGLI